MPVDDPWAIDGLQLSALEFRRAIAGLLMHDSDPISARPGVLSGCAVTVSTLTATVGGGQMVITPQVGANGSYLVGMTATTLSIAIPNATYDRIDRVVARIYDNSIDGSGQNRAAVEIVTGTPSASPAPPALPAGTLELAQLQVPRSGGGSVVVVDSRTWTGAAISDTGWVNVGLAPGYTAVVPVQVRRVGDTVRWRGRVAGAALATTGQKTITTAIPEWARATSYQHTLCPISAVPNNIIARAQVAASGLDVTIGVTGCTDIWLSALRYDVP